jgi:hypothetical protein
MPCRRCQGLMVDLEPCLVMDGFDVLVMVDVRQCVNCGNVEDPVILSHRAMTQAERQSLWRPSRFGTRLCPGRDRPALV